MRTKVLLTTCALFVFAGCGGSSSGATNEIDGGKGEVSSDVGSSEGKDNASIVVTNSILGTVVRDVVGDAAQVTVVVPNGKDPHDFEPSAQDISALMNADLIVQTGLGYEETLEDPIDRAKDSGVVVFTASDYVELKDADGEVLVKEDDHDGEADHEDHSHEGGDPHFLSDPLSLLQLIPELGVAVQTIVSADIGGNVNTAAENLQSAHDQVRVTMQELGNTPCKLVTGHNSMRYFADRYGCEIIGAIIPGGSSTAEVTAGELSQLRDTARAASVQAIFIDEGTPENVANQIASELNISVFTLASHTVPSDNSYKSYVNELATQIVKGLTTA